MLRSSLVKQPSKLRAPSRTFASLSAPAHSFSSSSPFSAATTSSSRAILSPFASASRVASRQQQPLQWRNATVLSRWNSTDASKSEAQQPEVSDTTAKPTSEQKGATDGKAAAPEKSKAEAELEAKQKEIIDLRDKYLRSVADYRNLQERMRREVQKTKEFAIERFAKDLLESIDNLDRALMNVPQEALADKETNKDLVNLLEGLKMTETVLMSTLEKHGLVRFDPMNEKFNPNMHEATFEVEMPGKEPGTVFHVMSKGFHLNGRVLRAPKVGVVKASSKAAESSEAAPAS